MHTDDATHVAMVPDASVPSHEVESTDKKRRRVCRSWGILSSVVDKGGNMSGTEIMKTTGASRSIAFAVVKKAKLYPSGSDELNRMPKIRNLKMVLATIMSLHHHLVDFPYADMVARFCQNAKCDAEESFLPDKIQAAVNRQKRSQRVWTKVMDRFNGRDAMNTLLCVLYSPIAVSTLVRAAHDDKKEFPGHIMIMRLGGVFIVLITDSNANGRFSLDWYLRRGQHTSAFIWLNIKESCWYRHRDVPSAMPTVDGSELEVNTTRSVQNVEKFETLSKVSEVTIAGIHFLKFLRAKAEDYSDVVTKTGPIGYHLYLMPYTRTTTGKSFKIGGTTPVSDKWCVDVDKFVSRFAVPRKHKAVVGMAGDAVESEMVVEQVSMQVSEHDTEAAPVDGLECDGGGVSDEVPHPDIAQASEHDTEAAPVDGLECDGGWVPHPDMSGQVSEDAMVEEIIEQEYREVPESTGIDIHVNAVVEYLVSQVELQDTNQTDETITHVGSESESEDEPPAGGGSAPTGASDQTQQGSEQQKQPEDQDTHKFVSRDETQELGMLDDGEVSGGYHRSYDGVSQQEHDPAHDLAHDTAHDTGRPWSQPRSSVDMMGAASQQEDESWLCVMRDEEGCGGGGVEV